MIRIMRWSRWLRGSRREVRGELCVLSGADGELARGADEAACGFSFGSGGGGFGGLSAAVWAASAGSTRAAA